MSGFIKKTLQAVHATPTQASNSVATHLGNTPIVGGMLKSQYSQVASAASNITNQGSVDGAMIKSAMSIFNSDGSFGPSAEQKNILATSGVDPGSDAYKQAVLQFKVSNETQANQFISNLVQMRTKINGTYVQNIRA